MIFKRYSSLDLRYVFSLQFAYLPSATLDATPSIPFAQLYRLYFRHGVYLKRCPGYKGRDVSSVNVMLATSISKVGRGSKRYTRIIATD